MRSRRDILRAHYIGLLKRAATWAGALSVLAMSFVAVPASAAGAQMGSRSMTPSTLKAGATGVTYAFSFKPSATNSGSTIGSMMLEVCDSPLEASGCAASASAGTNSNGASIATATFTSLTGTGCTGGTWAVGAGTGPGVSGTSRKFTNSGTAVAPTSAQTCILTIGGVTNPAGNKQNFYVRLTTYNTTTYTSELDFGGTAEETSQDLTVTASVQEALTFCAGDTVTSGCASTGAATISLSAGNSSCPALGSTYTCNGTSMMAASTNGNSGYSITYTGTTFTNTSATDTITAIGGTVASSTTNTKQFGLAGTTKSGAGSGTWNTTGTNYDFSANGNKYAYVTGSAQQIALASAATAENIYTVTYIANVDPTTKPGIYNATVGYICTGLF